MLADNGLDIASDHPLHFKSFSTAFVFIDPILISTRLLFRDTVCLVVSDIADLQDVCTLWLSAVIPLHG